MLNINLFGPPPWTLNHLYEISFYGFAAPSSSKTGSTRKLSQGRAQRSGSRFKAEISRLAMDHETRNGTGGNNDEEYTNIYFIVGDRRETATYKADQVTDMELKGKSI